MFRLILLEVIATVAFGQDVSVKDGNVFYKPEDGGAIQITSSGMDADPCLSQDAKLIAFVRRTPSMKIDTGLGETGDNELWIAPTTGSTAPRRVLVGHPGGFKEDENLVLAGFSRPQFSPDATRIYFAAQTWATALSFRMLDLKSYQVRYLYAGLGLEVLQSGEFKGYLIARKVIRSMLTARIFRYWLLDPDGKDVGEIGDTEDDVRQFKEERS